MSLGPGILASSKFKLLAAAPLDKALYPHCLVLWRGLKAVGPLAANTDKEAFFLSGQALKSEPNIQ